MIAELESLLGQALIPVVLIAVGAAVIAVALLILIAAVFNLVEGR